MKTILTKIILLALCLVLLFTLAACGDKDEKDEGGDPTPCVHADADRNDKCDKCGADYKAPDIIPGAPSGCSHVPGDAVVENEEEGNCLSEGSYDEVVYCTVAGCGAEISRTIKKTDRADHTVGDCIIETKKEATCYECGLYDEVYCCTLCGEEISRGEKEIGTLPHTPGVAVAENTVPATCTVDGHYEEVRYCTVPECGAEVSRELKTVAAAGAHTPATPVIENNEAASCFAGGSYDEVVYCSVTGCGAEISRVGKTLPATGAHTPAAPISENIVPATCTADGSCDEVVYCSTPGCSAELSRENKIITSPGHTPASAVAENTVPATCYAEGSYEAVVYCSASGCNHEISRTYEVIEKAAHTPASAVTENNVPTTCYAEGSYDEVVYCSVTECRDEISRTHRTVDKIGHTPAEAVRENVSPASCTAEGSYEEVVYCSVELCGAELSREAKTLPVEDHGYQGYYCGDCRAPRPASVGLQFTSNGDGTCHVSGIGSCTDEVIVIPETSPYDGTVVGIKSAFGPYDRVRSVYMPDTVTYIGDYAFFDCIALESIVISDSVKSIGNSAFSECENLASVIIGSGVEVIGSYAFEGCTALKSVNIPAAATEIGYNAFKDCTALEEVIFEAVGMDALAEGACAFTMAGTEGPGIRLVIGKDVKSVPANLFYPYPELVGGAKLVSVEFEAGSVCESIGAWAFPASDITSIVIPDSVKSIGDFAFYMCDELSSLHIGEGLSSMEQFTLVGCDALAEISVDADNAAYKNIDGNHLCTKDGKVLIKYAVASSATSFTVPDGVEKISEYAFAYATALRELRIADTVTEIGNKAVSGCTALVTLDLGEGVKTIGESAFSACTALKSIDIPASVTSIGYLAFRYCTSVELLRFNAAEANDFGLRDFVFEGLGSETGGVRVVIGKDCKRVPAYLLFYYNTNETTGDYAYNIASLEFEGYSTCKSIGEYAFYGCAAIRKLVIPDTVEKIEAYAFMCCSGITDVTLGTSLKEIGTGAFYGCYRLCLVRDGSEALEITAGDMANGKVAYYALHVAPITDNTIDVERDGDGFVYFLGFDGKLYLVGYEGDSTDVVLPAVALYGESYVIYKHAFRYRTDITSVVIGTVVEEIQGGAFAYCSNLDEIKYRGTEEEWNALTKGAGWNSMAGDCTLTYNYEE